MAIFFFFHDFVGEMISFLVVNGGNHDGSFFAFKLIAVLFFFVEYFIDIFCLLAFQALKKREV